MADVFLSYAREDEDTVERLHRALEAHEVTVWRDHSIRANEPFSKAIEQQIKAAKAVVVCWSPSACESEFVDVEAALAKRLNKYLGCVLAPAELPIEFSRINAIDLTRWNGASDDMPLLRLCEPLGDKIGGDIGMRLAGLAEARRRDEAASAEAAKALEEAERARAAYERRRREIEADRARQRQAELHRSIGQKYAALLPPLIAYCVWINPLIIAFVFLSYPVGYLNAATGWLTLACPYAASLLLWWWLLRPHPAPPRNYFLSMALQWPLSWLLVYPTSYLLQAIG